LNEVRLVREDASIRCPGAEGARSGSAFGIVQQRVLGLARGADYRYAPITKGAEERETAGGRASGA
jgi:hypothetical protein